MSTDIQTPEDVALLVRSFYARVYRDEVLRPVFEDVAGVNMEDHLPTMNRFWESVLLAAGTYHGNPLEVHRQLHRMAPLNECQFMRWLTLFQSTVDEHFEGPRATYAKQAAGRIASRFQEELQVGLLGRPFQRVG